MTIPQRYSVETLNGYELPLYFNVLLAGKRGENDGLCRGMIIACLSASPRMTIEH